MHIFTPTILFSSLIASAAAAPKGLKGRLIDPEHFKVAAIREPPVNYALPLVQNRTWVNLDLNATISQSIKTIKMAKEEGVNLIAFPELYFPGFPIALNYNHTVEDIAQYVSQSMRYGGPEWNTLVAAVKDAGLYASIGFSELDNDAIYMGQVLVGPDGKTLHRHRKLRPSGTERDMFSDGDLSSLTVVQTEYGRIGSLDCYEHLHPTMTFPMQAQQEDIHIAAFPWGGDVNDESQWWEDPEGFRAIVRTYSTGAGAVSVMPAIGKAAIYSATGLLLNSSDATTKLHEMPYITAVLNSTAFRNMSYDPTSQYSWSAVIQILESFPSYLPKQWNAFFDKVYLPIKLITTEIVHTINA